MKQNPNPWAPAASLRALAPMTRCNVHAVTHACVQSRQAGGMAGAKWGARTRAARQPAALLVMVCELCGNTVR